MTQRKRLSDADSTKLRRLYGDLCLLGSIAGRLDDRADRQERALEKPRFPQEHNHARKVIADLRSRAQAAREDQAAAWAGIDALSQNRSPAP